MGTKSNKQLLFNHEIVDQSGNGNGTNPFAKSDAMVEKFNEFKAHAEKVSLTEIFKEMGIVENTSKGGHPALTIGKPDGPVTILKEGHGKSALNAMRDWYKYQSLEYGNHMVWHNPALASDDVWLKHDGTKWVFYSYKAGRYYLSPLNKDLSFKAEDPKWLQDWKEEARTKRSAMIAKHDAIDEILFSLHHGGCAQVVLFSTELKAHYNEWVKGLMEMTFAEVQKKVGDYWAKVDTIKTIQNGRHTYAVSTPRTEEQLGWVEKVAAATKPVDVMIKTYYSLEPIAISFDPSSPRKDAMLEKLRQLSPDEVIVGIQVPEA